MTKEPKPIKVVMGTSDKYAYVPLKELELSEILRCGRDLPMDLRDLLQRAGENVFKW